MIDNIDREILNEVKGFDNEKKNLPLVSEVKRNMFAEKLVNGGLGFEIKQTLKTPQKISKFQYYKMRLKLFFNNLMDVL